MRKPVYHIQLGQPKAAPIIHHGGRDYVATGRRGTVRLNWLTVDVDEDDTDVADERVFEYRCGPPSLPPLSGVPNIWATADGKVLPGDLLDRTGL
jgi:hypothetical protein